MNEARLARHFASGVFRIPGLGVYIPPPAGTFFHLMTDSVQNELRDDKPTTTTQAVAENNDDISAQHKFFVVVKTWMQLEHRAPRLRVDLTLSQHEERASREIIRSVGRDRFNLGACQIDDVFERAASFLKSLEASQLQTA